SPAEALDLLRADAVAPVVVEALRRVVAPHALPRELGHEPLRLRAPELDAEALSEPFRVAHVATSNPSVGYVLSCRWGARWWRYPAPGTPRGGGCRSSCHGTTGRRRGWRLPARANPRPPTPLQRPPGTPPGAGLRWAAAAACRTPSTPGGAPPSVPARG